MLSTRRSRHLKLTRHRKRVLRSHLNGWRLLKLASLHELKQLSVWVRLELIDDKDEADHVLLQPLLLHSNHLIYLCLVLDQLGFFAHKVANVVPEQVVRDDEAFTALAALLPGVRDAIRVIVVLARRTDQDALLLQLQQIVNIVGQLLQLNLFYQFLVDRGRIRLCFG